MNHSRGDIVLVDFPYSDRTGSKVRPALVVQTDVLNRRTTDTIIAAISRSTHRLSPYQLLVDINTSDGAATGLRHNSTIQCENLLTIDQRHVLTTIGQLTANQLEGIKVCLKSVLDLD